jgi:hypothetical protein
MPFSSEEMFPVKEIGRRTSSKIVSDNFFEKAARAWFLSRRKE